MGLSKNTSATASRRARLDRFLARISSAGRPSDQVNGGFWDKGLSKKSEKSINLSLLRMQESIRISMLEIPAFAGMTEKPDFLDSPVLRLASKTMSRLTFRVQSALVFRHLRTLFCSLNRTLMIDTTDFFRKIG
ncbi:MAG: hypothetical protein D6743_13470 [Calditrichaeota bacterium]|nr:MAG: hypothetical protein D6743_13470 [Calditrichota bacterium]